MIRSDAVRVMPSSAYSLTDDVEPRYWISELSCEGNEKSLKHCVSQNIESCQTRKAAAVLCSNATTIESTDKRTFKKAHEILHIQL